MVQLDPHIVSPKDFVQFGGQLAILVFMSFIDLAFVTVFDIFTDGRAHTCPVHHSTECLLKTSCCGVL